MENQIIIKGKKYRVPELVLQDFVKYFEDSQKSNNKEKINLEKRQLMNDYSKLHFFQLKKKREISSRLNEITQEEHLIENYKIKSLSILYQIDDINQKYQYFSKLNNLICYTIDMLCNDTEFISKDIQKLHSDYAKNVNLYIELSNIKLKEKNYSEALNLLYNSMEKYLQIYQILLDEDNGKKFNYNEYIKQKLENEKESLKNTQHMNNNIKTLP